MNRRKIMVAALLPVIFAVSCVKKVNLNHIVVDDWQPDWALPILKSDLTLSNIVQTGTVITEDAAGLYSLHYDGKIFTARAADYIRIPDQNYSTPTVTLTVPQTVPSYTGTLSDSFANHFNYNDTSGAQLSHIMLKAGTLAINVNTTFKQNVSLVLTFPNITKDGTPLQIGANIAYPATSTIASTDLAGYTMDMTNGGSMKNYVAYKINYTLNGTGQPLSPGDNISANVSMSNIAYSFLDGFLGHYSIPIPSDTIDVEVFNNTLTANIFLRDPRLHLAFTNSFGLGVKAAFDSLYGLTNKGERVNMTIPSVSVGGAPTPGTTAKTTNTIDSTNSTIQNMFNPAPNHVIYNGRIEINPTASTTYNFVSDTSTISLLADAELPAWFKILDFAMLDTQKMLLPQDTTMLQSAEFKVLMDNGIPVYGGIQIYFADSLNNVVDSLMPNDNDLIGQAPVDGAGIATGTTQQITKVIMNHDHYNAMASRVRKAFIKARLKSSGNSTVQIHSNNHLLVKLAFRFKLRVSSQEL